METAIEHSKFRVTKLNKGRVAIELLTAVLVLDVVSVIGQRLNHSTIRHEWLLGLLAADTRCVILLLTHVIAERHDAGAFRTFRVRFEWPLVAAADKLRLLNVFPASMLTVLFFRVVIRYCWQDDHGRLQLPLLHSRLARLVAVSTDRKYSEAIDLAKESEATPGSLVEYAVARDLRDVLLGARVLS